MYKEIITNWQEIVIKDNTMPIYIAKPQEEDNYPCVIIFQEIFGVNNHLKDVTERVAREGFIAICPDLFYHEGKHFESGYENMDKAFEQMSKFSNDKFLIDLDYLLEYIHQMPNLKDNSVSTLGFCLGGQLSYLSACTKDIKSAVCYYGGRIMDFLDQTPNIKCPILLFFGDSDPYIPVENVEKIKSTLLDNQIKADLYLYNDATHGFFCNERDSYNENAASHSWFKTISFLQDN